MTKVFVEQPLAFPGSANEEKHVNLPTTLNFNVRRGKPKINTLQNHPEVF